MAENAAPGELLCGGYNPDNWNERFGVWAYTARDTPDDTLTYSLEGRDADKFDIEPANGNVRTKAGVIYNYETQRSCRYSGNGRTYPKCFQMTIRATDRHGLSDSEDVIVRLDDQFEIRRLQAPSISNGRSAASSLRLSWRAVPQSFSANLSQYKVEYYKVGEPGAVFTKYVDKSNTTTDIRRYMVPDTEYMVRLLAIGTGRPENGFEKNQIYYMEISPWTSARTAPIPADTRPTAALDTDITTVTEGEHATYRYVLTDIPNPNEWQSTGLTVRTKVVGTTKRGGGVLRQYFTWTSATSGYMETSYWTHVGDADNGPLWIWLDANDSQYDRGRVSLCIDIRKSGGTVEHTPCSDVTGPELRSGTVLPGGVETVLRFNKDLLSSYPPSANQLRVTANGEDVRVVSFGVYGNVLEIGELSRTIRRGETVRVSYTDPTSGNDEFAIQDLNGRDAESFRDVLITNHSQVPSGSSAPGSGLTAVFHDVPATHDGETAFEMRIEFDEALTTGWEDLRGAITVTSGSITQIDPFEGMSDFWNVEITPTADSNMTITLAASGPCDEDKAVCANGRLLEEAVTAQVVGPPPATTVTNAEITNDAGENGTWDVGETVTAEVTFSAVVTVQGAPTLGVTLDGTRREAAYAFGSETTTLRFSYPVTADDAGATQARLVANGFNTATGIIGDNLGGLAVLDFEVEGEETTPLQAEFQEVPASHDGETAISMRIALDGALSTGWEGVRHSLAVTNGTLTGTHRIDGRSDLWGITVEPGSDEDVTVRLNASADCADPNKTMCTADGRRLEETVETTVPGPAPVTTVTRVSVVTDPGDNGTWDFGETVTAEVIFSAPVTVASAPTLGVALGGVRREAAYATGSGTATVRFSYPVTAADAGASEARLIANGFNTTDGTISDAQNRLAVLDFTVESAPTLAIADAQATEGAGVSLTFTVTLAPAATEAVTVDWATADGTATAGSDYTAGSGTLTFAAGDTSKTVTVAVLDDSTDEISETVTLTLSNASGASIGDGEATGTLADNEGPAPLTVTFTNAPDAHDGSTAFPLRISLDAALSTAWEGVRHSLAITNGTLTATHRIDGRSDLWGITVEPASDEDVTVRLNASADCADPKKTMCASGGRRVETAISTVIPGPRAPLTAAFQAAPLSHDGATTFTLRLAFSDAISTEEATLRDESLAVTGGTVTRAAKVEETQRPVGDQDPALVDRGGGGVTGGPERVHGRGRGVHVGRPGAVAERGNHCGGSGLVGAAGVDGAVHPGAGAARRLEPIPGPAPVQRAGDGEPGDLARRGADGDGRHAVLGRAGPRAQRPVVGQGDAVGQRRSLGLAGGDRIVRRSGRGVHIGRPGAVGGGIGAHRRPGPADGAQGEFSGWHA